MINRDQYLNRLISKMNNGLVKVITGIRRVGKSYLLFNIFDSYLKSIGISDDRIIKIALDKIEFEALRNPEKLYSYILERINGNDSFYIFIDEIQFSYRIKKKDIKVDDIAPEDRDLAYTTFYDVLNDLMSRKNLDLYVTGSNSRMLSKDIATTFRDRGAVIEVFPLTFSEFLEYKKIEKTDAWQEYSTYGGMPLAIMENDEKEKEAYLKSLFSRIYFSDIKERYRLKDEDALERVTDAVLSSVGSLTNPHKLKNALCSTYGTRISDQTVKNYLEYLEDSFLIKRAERYDIKGKMYLNYPSKYYATDIGIRNARLNFRQQEMPHIMENIIYNELISRGYSVDVGVVEVSHTENGKQTKTNLEIDFIVNQKRERTYIQSAFNIYDEAKRQQEIRPLKGSGDFFRKIVITNGNEKKWQDDDGIIYIGIIPFLLDKQMLET